MPEDTLADVRRGSGGPWEDAFGYSRAVRRGDVAVTAGCTSVVDGQVRHPGDAAAQTRVALTAALDALGGVGAGPGDVVHTRLLVVHRADAEAVGRVHGEILGAVRPAATLLLVAGLLDPAMLVEVELTAVVAR